MNKKLLVFAFLGAFVGLAQAQSFIQIYGVVDAGFVKESGSDSRIGDNEINTIGVRGYEDLGGGLKATFELERQFALRDGEPMPLYNSDKLRGQKESDWNGASNIGIAGDFGKIRIGHIYDIAYEYFLPMDPFGEGSAAASLTAYTRTYTSQLANTIRYDSPKWNNFAFSTSFSTKGNSKNTPKNEDNTNYGFAGSIRYEGEPLTLVANYTRLADSNKSWVYNLGAVYQWGPARFSAGYKYSIYKKLKPDFVKNNFEETFDKDTGKFNPSEFDRINQKEWEIGLVYDVGPGLVQLAYSRAVIDDWKTVGGDKIKEGAANRYAIGYVYELSKRTSLYTNLTYTDSDNKHVGGAYNSNGAQRESVVGFQLGMSHKF